MTAKTIKITMLANSGVGKTCYILAMYGGMHHEQHGFTLIAENEEQDTKLLNHWGKLVNGRGETRWPQGTGEEVLNYDFYLNYAGNSLVKFQWIDYRGGAILDNQKKEDVIQLKNFLNETSCLFLCISGKLLQEPITDKNLGEILVSSGINRMNNILTYLRSGIKRRNIKYFPLVITISKYDYCYPRKKEDLMADVQRIFPLLFCPNSGWLVMICPISLGKELKDNPLKGRIQPENCHLPLIFALWCSLREDVIKTGR